MKQGDEGGVSLAKDHGPAAYPATDETTDEAQGERPLDAFLTGGAYGALALLGLVVGVIGSFNYGWTIGTFPLGSLVLVALTTAGVWLAGWAMGTRLGAGIPWAAWMAIVVVLSTGRSEGDLIISGDTAGYVFIIGGMVAGGIAMALVKPSRPGYSWLLGPGAQTPR